MNIKENQVKKELKYGLYKYIYNGEIIYIGKSDHADTGTGIPQRIYDHSHEAKFIPYLKSVNIMYLPMENDGTDEIKRAERGLIAQFCPILNVADKPPKPSKLDYESFLLKSIDGEWKTFKGDYLKYRHVDSIKKPISTQEQIVNIIDSKYIENLHSMIVANKPTVDLCKYLKKLLCSPSDKWNIIGTNVIGDTVAIDITDTDYVKMHDDDQYDSFSSIKIKLRTRTRSGSIALPVSHLYIEYESDNGYGHHYLQGNLEPIKENVENILHGDSEMKSWHQKILTQKQHYSKTQKGEIC